MTPQLVVFDFDGTLANLPVDWDGLRHALAQHFPSIDFVRINPGLVAVRDQLGGPALSEAYEILRRYEAAAIPAVEPIEATMTLLRRVRSGGSRVAVCSDNLKQTIVSGLRQLGLTTLVDVLIGKEDVRQYKPDPEGLLRLLDQLAVGPEEALFVGDGSRDEQAARAAGVRFLLVPPPPQ
jgi:phosphoglycolate phosphatase